MKAAVVSDYSRPPRYVDFPEPPETENYVPVSMEAAAVHQIVRSLAAGNHYGTGDSLPFVPGVDGVGILPDGTRAYVGGSPDPHGTLAERTIVPAGWAVPVPDGLSSAAAAAIVNPAVSSWLPLKYRAQLQPGQTVLILGATGVSGTLAVQLARRLGAGRIVAAGRNPAQLERLLSLGATDILNLAAAAPGVTADVKKVAADGLHVVLDYLWGDIAAAALAGLRVAGMARHVPPTHFVQIGALAGPSIQLDAALLRSSNVIVSGSGAGSLNPAHLLAEIPSLLEVAASKAIEIDFEDRPLVDVESNWGSKKRLVFCL